MSDTFSPSSAPNPSNPNQTYLQPSTFSTTSHPLIMCYYRRVRNVYRHCGHGVTLPDEEIKCDLPNCKFSPSHPKECQGPQCIKSCWQYHQYPQQYSPHIDRPCPQCGR
ncbi:hypothetical protein DFP72DRAFT_598082 [Ephemerocybe angulata]|uniref:Uncharacterized protein n=1 Tax=Ephemerocybe angulata TaxID=980116 RepID=A0A8H6MFH0_9AGAR|nr:hypothetical protein DFP72DRAFT_598082 [Tulosesus angulatus]